MYAGQTESSVHVSAAIVLKQAMLKFTIFYQLVTVFDFLTYAVFLHLSATSVWCNHRG